MAWRYWRLVDEYAEQSYLQAEGMPAPKWWKRRHWVEFVRVKRTLEALRLEDRKKELEDGR